MVTVLWHGPVWGAAVVDVARVPALTVRETDQAGPPKPRLLERHPADMGAAEITAFLTSLAVQGRVAASTQNQALSALLFLYREVLQQEVPWLGDLVYAKRPHTSPSC